MKTKQQFTLALLIFSVFSLPRSSFAQGSLTPPGPPGPMFKTLDQVQPRIAIGTNATPGDAEAVFKITNAGSYYLTANITGVAGKDGIRIDASGVTLDLMGFEMAGISNALVGIHIISSSIFGTLTNIAVRNGTVRDWGGSGIECDRVINAHLQDLRLSGNGGNGLGSGLVVNAPNAIIANCTAAGNAAAGISARGASISGCTVSANTINGIACFQSVITACTATGNEIGIAALDGSTIVNCVSQGNNRVGIRAGQYSIVTGNICNQNGVGIHVPPAGLGIGPGNRIENNQVSRNGVGLQVESAGNMVLRNSATGNTTNYVIISGNKVGVIVNAPNSGSISGDTGGAGVGTTDPWANFSF